MTAEPDLLPLRDWMECLGEISAEDIRDYARANVAHAVAPLQAEIEALRAEVERVTCELMDAITRADKLAEALRELRNHTSVNSDQIALIDAALEQENDDA